MDQKSYKSGMEDAEANAALNDIANDKLRFCTDELKKEIVRSDYKEFLELCMVVRALGAMHYARWMAKAIYSLKILLPRMFSKKV